MTVMVRAIIRPEKSAEVMKALLDAGYPAVTKIEVFGRGKQQGLKVGNVVYDELHKDCLLIVVPEAEKMLVIRTILNTARTGTEGQHGDGKIFVSPVEDVYTISTGAKESAEKPNLVTA
ncbi:P-II family nitrogen regulator [Phormidium sp. CCY1219]|uniref:P-II family nitrogen regulator n=1 Tax=Phormidium sp. CCY1219 TaxID=2886104 RepID=UPI002D1F809D|nr:P-II family nitrogen regulator [Phormidium sp. CCY1219]MEB3827179.1 P-II family nitrogen regulator [Phormidium sp. CCY1219]